ncbi:MAG: hypothetical protein HQK54_09040 [Oligoflexales bacterium]|nr:hypothetical protein [Oligoflexales bacterium]
MHKTIMGKVQARMFHELAHNALRSDVYYEDLIDFISKESFILNEENFRALHEFSKIAAYFAATHPPFPSAEVPLPIVKGIDSQGAKRYFKNMIKYYLNLIFKLLSPFRFIFKMELKSRLFMFRLED